MLGRIAAHTVAAAAIAIVANLVLRALGLAVFDVPDDFEELDLRAVIVSTIVGVIGAGIAAAIVARLASDPVRVYRIVVVVALVISLPPPLTIDGPTGAKLTMAAMHVVTAAICAAVLVRAFRARAPDPAPAAP